MHQTENKQIMCPFINIDIVPLSNVSLLFFKLDIRETHHFDSFNLVSYSSKAAIFVNIDRI